MGFFKQGTRLDDPDDNRKHYRGGKRLLIISAGALLIFILTLVYIFLPVWTYALLVPLLTVAFVWRPKEPDENARIRRYLSRIPAGERYPRDRFYRRVRIAPEQLAAAASRFPEWCGGEKPILESDEMYRLVLCWYYGNVKKMDDAAVVRLLQESSPLS